MIRRVPREEQGVIEPLLPRAQEGAAESAPALHDPEALSERLGRALVLLLGEELQLSPEHVRSVVERELLRVRRARTIELRVHPEDLALLEQGEHYGSSLELQGALTLTADPSLTRGGCVLLTDLGELDARLETRLTLALSLLARGVL